MTSKLPGFPIDPLLLRRMFAGCPLVWLGLVLEGGAPPAVDRTSHGLQIPVSVSLLRSSAPALQRYKDTALGHPSGRGINLARPKRKPEKPPPRPAANYNNTRYKDLWKHPPQPSPDRAVLARQPAESSRSCCGGTHGQRQSAHGRKFLPRAHVPDSKDGT